MSLSKEKAKRLLNEIYQIAINASITGELRQGVEPLCLTYNKIRDYAIENDWVEGDMILEISIETMAENRCWMDDIGVAAKFFLIHLEDEVDTKGFKIKDSEE